MTRSCIKIAPSQRQRLTDPQPGTPQHDDQTAQPQAVHPDGRDRRLMEGVALERS
jgi:hypothetical protein